MIRVLIVGAGDVARRLHPLLARRFRVFVLLRNADKAGAWRAAGATPIAGDLDDRRSLDRAAALAQWIVHLAPPPSGGADDPRTAHLLAALRRRASLAQRLVYISTSGVYGDCGGARIDESKTPSPKTPRGRRRLAAERRVRSYAKSRRASILRVPGIYAADRLPLARLQSGTPALQANDDVFTNHIHADDLAASVRQALLYGRSGRVYHVVDDSEQRMGDYFDAVADAFGLARPPRISRADAARQIDPGMLSFMSESRRLDNSRMKRELRLRLRYPNTAAGIAAALDPERLPC
ncbi:MAG TPA: SDR family oxidoreductase [Rhodocyclaceae bacterium]